jgi:excisionase family DNA binding protein
MDYNPEDFITLDEAAAVCHYKSPYVIRELIKRKELPVFKPSYRHILIPRVAFNKWVSGRIKGGWRPETANNNQAEE